MIKRRPRTIEDYKEVALSDEEAKKVAEDSEKIALETMKKMKEDLLKEKPLLTKGQDQFSNPLEEFARMNNSEGLVTELNDLFKNSSEKVFKGQVADVFDFNYSLALGNVLNQI